MRTVTFGMIASLALAACAPDVRRVPGSMKLVCRVLPPEPGMEGVHQLVTTFEKDGESIASPRIAVEDGQWATVSVIDAAADPSGKRVEDEWRMTDDGPRLDERAGIREGYLLALRCARSPDGGLETTWRAYYIEDGKIVGSVDAEERMTPGEDREIAFSD